MTQKEFEEEFVFNKYKDSVIESCKKFKKEVSEFKNIDVREVYAKITKYQIATYGASLRPEFIRRTKEMVIKSNNRANGRKYNKRIARGITDGAKKRRWTE